ncbi:MAG: hypothetical protein KJ063_01315 [Anaerolineae bacterium]|nr:hypothetical protein [Anaerolineae bacterium]
MSFGLLIIAINLKADKIEHKFYYLSNNYTGNEMITLLEILSGFYWLLLPQTWLQSLWYGGWWPAYRRYGCLGWLLELGRALLGMNMWGFAVPINGGWSGRDIQQLLAANNVPMWGWAFVNHTFLFHVPRHQAEWAEQVLLWAGVPLLGYMSE